MAVFLVNSCKFKNCGLTFPTLGGLIYHIEDTHIDNDPLKLERQEIQRPQCLALSYISRFYTETINSTTKREHEPKKKRITPESPASSNRSNTPTGSEFDELDDIRAAASDGENSDDSWTTQEDLSSELIVSMVINHKDDSEKPFACPVPGCKKRYKNINGIKYHAKHGHRKEARIRKPFKCECGKSYRTPQGLRNHAAQQHPTNNNIQLSVQAIVSKVLTAQANRDIGKTIVTGTRTTKLKNGVISGLAMNSSLALTPVLFTPTLSQDSSNRKISTAKSIPMLAELNFKQTRIPVHSLSSIQVPQGVTFATLSTPTSKIFEDERIIAIDGPTDGQLDLMDIPKSVSEITEGAPAMEI